MEPLVLVLAFTLDLIFAEPPLKLHPVFWFGKIVEFFDRTRLINDLVYGSVMVAAVVTFAIVIANLPLPQPLQFLWHTYLLFSAISVKSMLQHVKSCVDSGMSREEVGKIVSRDTARLSEPQLCSAVIESMAENYVDGVVAPLFYFVLFGIPGVVVYKAVNVCDAMVGYRNEKYEYFGKTAARLDDLLNYIPARLSLLFFEIVKRGSIRYGLKNNVKLNGCSIAAMSYVLGVKLEKPGYYTLPGRDADVSDVIEASEIFLKLSILAFVAFLVACAILV